MKAKYLKSRITHLHVIKQSLDEKAERWRRERKKEREREKIYIFFSPQISSLAVLTRRPRGTLTLSPFLQVERDPAPRVPDRLWL
jgi:hypothetical protein